MLTNEILVDMKKGIKPKCQKCDNPEAAMLMGGKLLCGNCIMRYMAWKRNQQEQQMNQFFQENP